MSGLLARIGPGVATDHETEQGPARDVVAWLVGVSWAIEVVTHVPSAAFEVARFAGLALVVVLYRPSLPAGAAARRLGLFVGGMAALALVRLAFTAPRQDGWSAFAFAAATLLALAAAASLAVRVQAHRPVLAGFAAGASLSAFVCLLQAADLPTPRPATVGVDRYPGLAIATPQLSWQLGLAAVAAVFLARTAPTRSGRLAGAAQALLCTLGIAVCGAQGGLYGVTLAVLVVGAFALPQLDWRTLVRPAVGLVALACVLGAVLVGSGLGAASVRGLVGDPDKGFVNEIARLDAAEAGVRELRAHPWTGVGQDRFQATHPNLPHFLPLNVSIGSGVAGLLLGGALVVLLAVTVLGGPVGRTPGAYAGLGLLSVMSAQTLVTTSGPFAGIGFVSLLLVAVVACRGGSDLAPAPHRRPSREARSAGSDEGVGVPGRAPGTGASPDVETPR